MKDNKTCAVCYSGYHYCPNCRDDKDKPTWMFVFCSENCHDIYMTTSAYANKKITAKEAKDKLDKLDISKYDNFGESYKTIVSEINDATKVVKKSTAKAVSKKENVFVNDSTEETDGKVDVE